MYAGVCEKNNNSRSIPKSTVCLLGQVVNSYLFRETFQKPAEQHGSDKYCKSYDAWSQLVCMIVCHLGGCRSIRDISHAMCSITGNINHLGVEKAPSKSTIAYQNEHRSPKIFRDFYYKLRKLLGQQMGGYSNLPNPDKRLKILDSTTITVPLSTMDWARYTSGKGAVKAHTLLNYQEHIPDFICMTTGKVADCKAARKIDLKKGDIVVADRGYQDFELLKYWDGNHIRFVVRHCEGIKYDQLIEMDLKEGENEHIIRDEYIRMTGQESSAYDEPLRRVVVYNEQHGYKVELLSNYLTLNAEEIAEIYRKCWYVESFFKELKQLLKIKTFIGTTKNALLTQIWTAMCAMLLVRFFQSKAKFKWHTSNLVIFLRMHLFCHVDLWSWLDCPFLTPRQIRDRGGGGHRPHAGGIELLKAVFLSKGH